MSFERWYLPCVRLLSVLAVIMVVTLSAQADDTWHNAHHSLKRFFTGKPSATPVVHHRVRRSEDREIANPSPASTPVTAEISPTPALPPLHASSSHPRLRPLRMLRRAPENPVRTPEAARHTGVLTTNRGNLAFAVRTNTHCPAIPGTRCRKQHIELGCTQCVPALPSGENQIAGQVVSV